MSGPHTDEANGPAEAGGTDATVAALQRHAKGKRPQLFADPAVDHLLAMVLELASELWVARERGAALEGALVRAGALAADATDTFDLDTATQQTLDTERQVFIQRLLRTLEGEV